MKFEGDVEDFSEVQRKSVEDILNEHNFNAAPVKVDPVGKKGDNYMATVKRLTVQHGDAGSTKMIVKLATTTEAVRQMLNTAILFRNEIVFYADVVPELQKMQKIGDIPEEECLKFPRYYGANGAAPHELIVLEDLRELGYNIRDRLVSLTDAEIRMVLNQIAQLHSLSFALKDKNIEIFDEQTNKLIDLWSILNQFPESQAGFEKIEQGVLVLMDSEEEKQLLKGSVSQICTLGSKIHADGAKSRHSVIIQGDCWTNNLMFKHEGENPIGCIMIDYQMAKCGSPAADILYLIFNCTDQETRSRNYEDWLDYYHKSLDDYLSYHSLKASHVYSRDQMDADLKKHGRFIFGISVMLATMTSRESEETLDFNQMAEEEVQSMMQETNIDMKSGLKETTTTRMKTRIQGLVSSFKEYGYV